MDTLRSDLSAARWWQMAILAAALGVLSNGLLILPGLVALIAN